LPLLETDHDLGYSRCNCQTYYDLRYSWHNRQTDHDLNTSHCVMEGHNRIIATPIYHQYTLRHIV